MYSKSSTTTKLYLFGDVFMRICIFLSIVLSNLAIQTTKVSADTGGEISHHEMSENPVIIQAQYYSEIPAEENNSIADKQLFNRMHLSSSESETGQDQLNDLALYEWNDFKKIFNEYIIQNQKSDGRELIQEIETDVENTKDGKSFLYDETPGLLMSFYDNQEFFPPSFATVDCETINFDWDEGVPYAGMPNNYYSIRWYGKLINNEITQAEEFTFTSTSDDGVRLWIDGNLVIDAWFFQEATEYSGVFTLEPGIAYDFVFEYFEDTLRSSVKLEMESTSISKRLLTENDFQKVDLQSLQSAFTYSKESTLADGQDSVTVDLTLENIDEILQGEEVFVKVDGKNDFINGNSVSATEWVQIAESSPSGVYKFELSSYEPGTKILKVKIGNFPIDIVSSYDFYLADYHTGLKAEYYSNMTLEEPSYATIDNQVIDYNWGDSAPMDGMPVDRFSVRWTGYIIPDYSETYTFYTYSDDGMRLWIDDTLLIDAWFDQGPTHYSGDIAMTAGENYEIIVEYYENGGGAVAGLEWKSTSVSREVITRDNLFMPMYDVFNYEVDLSETEIVANGADSTQISINVTDYNDAPLSDEDVMVQISGQNNYIDGVLLEDEEWVSLNEVGTTGQYIGELTSTITGIKYIKFKIRDLLLDDEYPVRFVEEEIVYPECEISTYTNEEEEEVVELIVAEGDSCRLVSREYTLTNLSVSGTLYLESTNYYDETSGEFYSDYVHIITDHAEVTETGHISADGQGYVSGEGPGAPQDGDSDNTPGGAGFAGYGSDGDLAGGDAYFGRLGDAEEGELFAGSGGGGPYGGAGGGIVYITMNAGDYLYVNGSISADGESGSAYYGDLYSGGGAGGTVLIDGYLIDGTGYISAKGGNSADDCTEVACGGGGSGGQLLFSDDIVYFTHNESAGILEANGGIGKDDIYGAAGYIVEGFDDYSNLIIDNHNNDAQMTVLYPEAMYVSVEPRHFELLNKAKLLLPQRYDEASGNEYPFFTYDDTFSGDGTGDLYTESVIYSGFRFIVDGFNWTIYNDSPQFEDSYLFWKLTINPGSTVTLVPQEGSDTFTMKANEVTIEDGGELQLEDSDNTLLFNMDENEEGGVLTVNGILSANGANGQDGGEIEINANVVEGSGSIQANGSSGESLADGGIITINSDYSDFSGDTQAYGGEFGEYAGDPGIVIYNDTEKLLVDNNGNSGIYTFPEGSYTFDRIELGNAVEVIFEGEGTELTVSDGMYGTGADIPVLTLAGNLNYTDDFILDHVILNWSGYSEVIHDVDISKSDVMRDGVDSTIITLSVTDSLGTPISNSDVYIKVSGEGNIINGSSVSDGAWVNLIESGNPGEYVAVLASTELGEKDIEFQVGYTLISDVYHVEFIEANEGNGLYAEYFEENSFEGTPCDIVYGENINFNLGVAWPSSSSCTSVEAVRWTGKLTANTSETYTIYTSFNEMDMWVDGIEKESGAESLSVDLIADEDVPFIAELMGISELGSGILGLTWESTTVNIQNVPLSSLSFVNIGQLTVSNTMESIEADGEETTEITIEAIRDDGLPLVGYPVYIQMSDSGNYVNGILMDAETWTEIGVTDETGTITGLISTETGGSKTARFTIAGMPLEETVSFEATIPEVFSFLVLFEGETADPESETGKTGEVEPIYQSDPALVAFQVVNQYYELQETAVGTATLSVDDAGAIYESTINIVDGVGQAFITWSELGDQSLNIVGSGDLSDVEITYATVPVTDTLLVTDGETVFADEVRTYLTGDVTVGSTLITVNDATGFYPGHLIVIAKMTGDNAGEYEEFEIVSVSGNQIELDWPVEFSYMLSEGRTQVIREISVRYITVQSGGTISANVWNGYTGGVVFLNSSLITVESGGYIHADVKGFAQKSGPGAGTGVTGGGYGGEGASNTYPASTGNPYGSHIEPFLLGSGGGAPDLTYGGRGAGIVRLNASTIVNDGSISANGGTGGDYYNHDGGGGSGGSVWISAGALSGNGTIKAIGGRGGKWIGYVGYGGGGGRIYLGLGNNQFTGVVQAFGGYGQKYGGAGTIYWGNGSTLIIDNNNYNSANFSAVLLSDSYSFANVELKGNGSLIVRGDDSVFSIPANDITGDGTSKLTIEGEYLVNGPLNATSYSLDVKGKISSANTIAIGANQTVDLYSTTSIYDGAFTFDSVEVQSNGILNLHTVDDGDEDYTNDNPFELIANNVSVAVDGLISLDGAGYRITTNIGNGPGGGWGSSTSGSYGVGGSHGGLAGESPDGTVSEDVYGDMQSPVTMGSAGGRGGSSVGGNGGGALHLSVANLLDLDGSITANGNASATNGGAGSGGSLWIEAAQIDGSGNVIADGGNSPSSSGGGGGRISIIAPVVDSDISTSVVGGTGANESEHGTIYVGEVDETTSTVEADPTEVAFGGIAASDVLATLISDSGHAIPYKDIDITLINGSTVLINGDPLLINQTISLSETDLNGEIHFEVSATTLGTRELMVSVDGVELTTHVIIDFTAGDFDPNLSTIESSPQDVPADGVSTATITATANNIDSLPIINVDINLSADGSAVVTQPTALTNEYGQAVGYVSNSVVENVTGTADAWGIPFQNSTIVNFYGTDFVAVLGGPTRVLPAQAIQMTVTVRNLEEYNVDDVAVELTLPELITYSNDDSGVTPDVVGQVYTWMIPEMLAGENIQFNINGIVSDTAVDGDTMNISLSTSSAVVELNEEDNSTQTNLTVVQGYSFDASISPTDSSLYIGGEATYNINVKNADILPDLYTISVSGLDTLDVSLNTTELAINSGASKTAELTIGTTSCISDPLMNFDVTVTSTQSGIQQVIPATVTFDSSPQISLQAPANDITSGSQSVLFSWITDPETTGTLTIYPTDDPAAIQTYTTESGLNHAVQVENLLRNTSYTWYVEVVSACGTNTSIERELVIGNGIVFGNHNQNVTINRDYDQRIDVTVQNTDTIAHTLTSSVVNPYEDLIVNFVEAGSIDQTITLEPGETANLTLALHAQDAELHEYTLTANLIADDGSTPIVDNATLNVNVLFEVDYTIEEDIAAYDPVTLAHTYIITNHGQPITDLSLEAVDPDTGLPASIYLTPSLDHAYLGTGETIEVVAYPIFTEEDAANQIVYSPTFHMAKQNLDMLHNIYFTLNADVAGVQLSLSGVSACGDGKAIYGVVIDNCALNFKTKDWYCTNRPSISTPFNVPAFLTQDVIRNVTVSNTYSRSHWAAPHNGEIYFNGSQIVSFTDLLPDGSYEYPVPVSLWNDGIAGLTTQNIKLVTQHYNGGHYIISTGYNLSVDVNNARTYACAANETQAMEVVEAMYPCNAVSAFNAETDVFNRSVQVLGEIKSLIKSIAAAQNIDISVSICTQGECGDPVDSRTGVFSFSSPDISFPTSAGTLAFQRSYSTGAVDQYSTVGYGWTHNHEERLIFPDMMYGMADYMIFRDHMGNQHLFKIKGDGTYTPGPGVLAELTAITDGYQVTSPDGHVFTFNSSGIITELADSQGNVFTYTYDVEGVLQRVSADDDTRYLDFTYNDDIRIEMVTDYTGRQVTFEYDEDGNLISSTDLLGQEWTYDYNEDHRMLHLIDPTGLESVSNTYDMVGHIARQYDGEGNLLIRLKFDSEGNVTVYDADGHSETHSYDSRGILIDETDRVNRGTDTNYDANFRPTSITNEIGSELTMEWSEDGKQLLAEVDPAGNRTEYTYDENGNLTSTTDPSGNTKSYTYDGNLLTSSTDIEGKTTTYTYTAEGWLETQTDHYGRTTTYTYDEHGQRLTTTDWQGVITSNVYDELGRQIESVDEQGRVNRNEYNAAGQLVRSIRNYDAARPQNDGNVFNLTTTYTYDVYGNQKTVTDTLGNTTTYHYDTNSRLTSTIDAMGHETSNTYDANGQLVKSTDALGRETTYVYDAAGRRLSTINALGISSGITTFDLTNNASTASDSAGNAATYYYNALNQVVRIVDPMGHETSTTYNENGNVETKTDELGRTTTYEYDALNRLVKTTDASGAVTQTVYDENGYRTASIDALGHETTYTYDEMGRVVSTTDALGHTTSSDYDEDGKLVSTTDAMGRTTTYTYDEWDRKASMTDGAGRTTTYTYDELDRVISTSGPTGTTSTVYDALGRVVSRTDERGHTTTTTYDDLGRVKTTTDYQGNVTENFYDVVGNLVATRLNEDNATGYEYDVLNRQVAVTDPLGNRTQTVYDNLGNVSDTINAKGIVTHYVYDSLQRNTAIIQNYKPGEEADADTNVRVDYTYNAVGNRTYVNDANGHVTEFQYDAANRVTRKTDPIGNTWDYVYDAAGNLTSRTDGNNVTTYFVYDDGGNLLTIDYPEGEADVSFTYNNAEQRVSMTDGIGTTTWHYDELSRVDSVNDAYGNEIVYTYDEYGNRTGLQYADGKQVAYDFDNNNRLVEVASWDSLETEYDYDALGQLTSILRPNGVESTYKYDELGRLTSLDHSNDVTSLANYTYTYDELGNIIHAEENVMGGGSYGPTILVTVVDTTGEPLEGNTVYAYSGDEFSNYSKVTDEKGQVSITLPDGTYRFRVDVDGTEFWSGESDHCEIGACGQVTMTIPEAVLVTVIDSNNNYLAEQVVYAYEGETYSKYSGETDENGQASLRLPEGEYRFKTMLDSTTFWSAALEDEQCVVPGCTVDEILVTVPLLVTVQNDLGDPMVDLNVYAYDDATYADVFGKTDENGQVELSLPEGEYHFRADYNGTQFWSAEANHCAIPGCSEAAVTVSLPVTVTVADTGGGLISGVNVYAFDESTYQNFSKPTDENGEAVFTLPGGNYRFRADYNGTQFWSGTENTCEIPGCTIDAVTVTQPVSVTVLDSNGAPQAGLNVYAFDSTTYKNYSKKTDTDGVAVFTLPLGDYRFRADLNGTQFWSGASNTCSLPDCNADQVAVTIPVEVFVQDGASGVEAINVYAFNESTYSGYSKTTDSEGVARFTLPEGEYRFRADYAGEQIFSGENNHCTIPGCELVSIQVGTEPTETPTVMPTETFTETSTPEFTDTYTFTPVQTTVPDNTSTPIPENTNTPTIASSNTPLPVDTDTPEPINTDTPEPVSAYTPSPEYSFTPTMTRTLFGAFEPVRGFGRFLAKIRLAPLADDTGVSVTVMDSDGMPQSGLNVYAFDGSTFSGSHAVTNESGIASFTLAEGSYRFRADLNGTRFWSGEENTCTTPNCVNDSVTVTKPLTITVVDSDGTAQTGLNVYAFNGTTYAGYSKATNENGEAVFTLPEGEYRFRADFNGTRFWSADENHCTLPGCESTSVSVTKPLTVTVRNSDGAAQAGLNVYAFDGTTYAGYSKVTNESGEAVFTLPAGDYHFRADMNGTRFWSAEENHCTLPGCESVDVSVTVPLSVSVVDTDGTPQSGIAVYAFNGTTFMSFSKTTDEYGQAVFTLPQGDYRFRADAGGTYYWSSEENDCTLPGCTATTVTTSKPVTVSVVDSVGAAMSGLNVYAFDGTTYAGYSKVSDEYGNAVFYLPAGDYRFRADREGTQFWSSEENACTLPGCENVIISVTLSVTVNVTDTDGTPQEGLNVYAFDGETYSNYSKVTDENGLAVFSLPEGDYHFRADLNGTQFWSADENTCTLPGCVTDSVTVTKPVTVTVAGEEGNPYADLNVYVFNGETYAGYSGKTDAGGHVIFTLPQGDYHFRADFDGVQFWSGNENTCTIPGCEEGAVILPGGTGEQEVSIDYTYDALNRLISAEYSNGTAFGYTYDAAGNVLTYAETHYGQTTVTTYTYDAANQLLTAVEDETVWQYSYDGNGSLIQTDPGTEVANGSTHYTYNTAGYLTKVENYTTEWQTQSEMTYDGLGNRLAVTTYTDGEGNTTRYVLDSGAELTAIGTDNTTYYLYGLGAIGTLGESWSYMLQDGAGSTRQLVDEEGSVNLSVSYTPWGDTMEIYGSGMLNLGYLGGMYDAGTGLIYMGNGKYYDPSTGRLLSLNMNVDRSNPNMPLNSDPVMMLISPLLLLGLVFGRKKEKSKIEILLIIIVIIIAFSSTIFIIEESFIPIVSADTERPPIGWFPSPEEIDEPILPSVDNESPSGTTVDEEIPSNDAGYPSNPIIQNAFDYCLKTRRYNPDIQIYKFSTEEYSFNNGAYVITPRDTYLYYLDLVFSEKFEADRWWIEGFEHFSIYDYVALMTYFESNNNLVLYPILIEVLIRQFNEDIIVQQKYNRDVYGLVRKWTQFSGSNAGYVDSTGNLVKRSNYDRDTIVEGSKAIQDAVEGRDLRQFDYYAPFDYGNESNMHDTNPDGVNFCRARANTIIVPFFLEGGDAAYVLSGCAWHRWFAHDFRNSEDPEKASRWTNRKACDWLCPTCKFE